MMTHDLTRFFPGDQEYHRFDIPLHKGKATLSCVVRHRWEQILFCTVNCGNTREDTVTRRVGFGRTDCVELEAAAKASLGFESLAKLGSAITEKSSTEVRFDESTELTKKLTFEAPKCGRLTVLLYQLVRLYGLRYEDRRFFHRARWETTATEWLEHYFDGTSSVTNDPACGCSPDPVTGGDGVGVLRLNGLAMIVTYRRTANGLSVPGVTSVVDVSELVEPVPVSVRTADLPSHLRFVVGEVPETIDAVLEPHVQETPILWVDPELRELRNHLEGEMRSVVVAVELAAARLAVAKKVLQRQRTKSEESAKKGRKRVLR